MKSGLWIESFFFCYSFCTVSLICTDLQCAPTSQEHTYSKDKLCKTFFKLKLEANFKGFV